jgi:hypothetical protein
VTTTDLWIDEEESGTRLINYSSGLFGPAADGLDRLKTLVAAGDAAGTYDGSSADVTLTGAVLMPLIRSLGDGHRTDDMGSRQPVLVRLLEGVIVPDRIYRPTSWSADHLAR